MEGKGGGRSALEVGWEFESVKKPMNLLSRNKAKCMTKLTCCAKGQGHHLQDRPPQSYGPHSRPAEDCQSSCLPQPLLRLHCRLAVAHLLEDALLVQACRFGGPGVQCLEPLLHSACGHLQIGLQRPDCLLSCCRRADMAQKCTSAADRQK